MNNIQKAKEWIKMAHEDLKDAEIDLEHERHPSSVFHSQQASEKVCKAVLLFFGIEPGKTHFPSYEIKSRILRGNFQLSENQIKVLERIIDLSSVLESQKEFPRYGWETKERIVPPSEIYDEKRAKLLFENAKEVLKLVGSIVGRAEK
jgi:HEPN domain-containing protein